MVVDIEVVDDDRTVVGVDPVDYDADDDVGIAVVDAGVHDGVVVDDEAVGVDGDIAADIAGDDLAAAVV